MKNIKLFENFDSRYLWPEAKFWIDKLEPEEICFLGVYSYMLEKESNKNQPLFEVEYDGTNEAEPDDNGDGSLEMLFAFPVAKAEYDPSLSCDIQFSGRFSEFYSGNYYNDPPEGGEYELNDINIGDSYYLDKDQINEYELDKMEYKSEFVTKSDMTNLLEFIAGYFINYDDDRTDSKKPVIPQGLKDKCENLRKEMPNVTKGYGMISRFTGK